MSLSQKQLHVISLAERAGGAASVVGSLLIIITYSTIAEFRKPVRKMIFYATLGNVFSSAACLISNAGVQAGSESAICQLQAFFVQ